MATNLSENAKTMKMEIFQKIKIANGLELKSHIEKSLEKMHRISDKISNIEIKSNFIENYANDVSGANKQIIELNVKLERLRDKLLEGIRFQTQLYLICNDIKDVLTLIDAFDENGLDIMFGVAKNGNFQNLTTIIDDYTSENNVDNSQCKPDGFFLIEYLKSYDTTIEKVQNGILNLKRQDIALNSNVNYEIQKGRPCKYTVIFPILFAAVSFSGLYSIPLAKFQKPISTIAFLIGLCIGYRQDIKNYGIQHKNKLIELGHKIDAIQLNIDEFVETISYLRETLSEKFQELKGFGFLMLGWRHSQTNFDVVRRDKSYEHMKDERLLEMVKELGDCTKNIQTFYNISKDEAWLAVEFLNNCHNRKNQANFVSD